MSVSAYCGRVHQTVFVALRKRSPVVILRKRPSKFFVVAWPLLLAAFSLGANIHRSWEFRLGVAVLVYVIVVTVLLCLISGFALARGIPLRALIRGRQTSAIPDDVAEYLPKIMWVLRNREPGRLRPLLLDGPLLSPDNIRYTEVLATLLAGEFVGRAMKAAASSEQTARVTLIHDALLVGAAIPTLLDEDLVERWMRHLLGEAVSHSFERPGDFTFQDLSALLALGAAAATQAQLNRAAIYRQYEMISELYSYGHRIPGSWKPRQRKQTS